MTIEEQLTDVTIQRDKWEALAKLLGLHLSAACGGWEYEPGNCCYAAVEELKRVEKHGF
jgi:hypothetical protein